MKEIVGWAVSWTLALLGDLFHRNWASPYSKSRKACEWLYQKSKDVQSWGGYGPWFFVGRRLK